MDSYKSITQQTYDEIADDYSKRDSEITEETFEVKALLDQFISLLPSGAHVLDVGCGGARDSIYMHAKGLQVTGIDLSERMVTNAKKKEPAIDYIQMDFENLQFDDNTFDGIWANASLHHVPKNKLPPVLKSIYNKLKPNGIFFSTNKHGASDGILENEKFGKRIKRHFSFYNPDELAMTIGDAGFVIEETTVSDSGEWVWILARK